MTGTTPKQPPAVPAWSVPLPSAPTASVATPASTMTPPPPTGDASRPTYSTTGFAVHSITGYSRAGGNSRRRTGACGARKYGIMSAHDCCARSQHET
eukprot:6160635-Pyramimonas_sp.AAC.1